MYLKVTETKGNGRQTKGNIKDEVVEQKAEHLRL
jgi:hypothetical protein